MNRDTQEIITPIAQQKVVINKWLTGAETRAIQNVYLDQGLQPDGKGGVKNITSQAINAAQDTAWKVVIVSVDGKTDDVVGSILSMRSEDFNFVVAAVNAITAGTAATEKKTI